MDILAMWGALENSNEGGYDEREFLSVLFLQLEAYMYSVLRTVPCLAAANKSLSSPDQ